MFSCKSVFHDRMKTKIICIVKKKDENAHHTISAHNLVSSRLPVLSLHKTCVGICLGAETCNQLPKFPRTDRMSDIMQTDGAVHTLGSKNRNTSLELNSMES